MRVENLQSKLTLSIPFDKVDCNGAIFTEKAIKSAINNFPKALPLCYRDNENVINGTTIGSISGENILVDWDYENKICNMTVYGTIFYGGADIDVYEIRNKRVTDFRFRKIGISK